MVQATKRSLPQAHAPAAKRVALAPTAGDGGCDYEAVRKRNIEELRMVTQSALSGVKEAQMSMKSMMSVVKKPNTAPSKPKKKREPAPLPPRRSSTRLQQRGDVPMREVSYDEPEEVKTKDAETYWKEKGVSPKLKVDGHFTGWVADDVRERFGIESSSERCWESNGGGKWTMTNPLGTTEDLQKAKALAKTRGWCQAKATSAMSLYKNPNCYFYRHTEPGVAHWQGEWTKEEHELFLEVAKKYGAGDRWGLFSSYIPHRVGYQCSQYYRAVMIGSGEIVDPNFTMDSAGRPVFVGRRGNNRRATKNDDL